MERGPRTWALSAPAARHGRPSQNRGGARVPGLHWVTGTHAEWIPFALKCGHSAVGTKPLQNMYHTMIYNMCLSTRIPSRKRVSKGIRNPLNFETFQSGMEFSILHDSLGPQYQGVHRRFTKQKTQHQIFVVDMNCQALRKEIRVHLKYA